MPQNKLKAQKLQAIRDLAAEWGKAVAEQALSGSGSDQQMDFHAMEQFAAAAAAGLTQGTIATLLEQQAKTLNTMASKVRGRDQFSATLFELSCKQEFGDGDMGMLGVVLTLGLGLLGAPVCFRVACEIHLACQSP